MTVGTVALFEKAYKVTYADGLSKYIEEESDLIRWFPKEESFGGWKFWLPFKLNGARVSTVFGTALSKKNVSKFVRMELTRSQGHGVISIDNEAANAAKNDADAFVDLLEDAVDSTVEGMTLSIEALLTGNGGGSIGQVASISTNTITLTDKSRIVLFQYDQNVQLSADDGVSAAAGVRAQSQDLTITGINISGGILTFNVNVTTAIAGAVANDYIYNEGDYDGQAQRVLQGMFAWIKDPTLVTSTAFFGLDRTIHKSALAGTYVNGGGANPFDVLKEACAINRRNRGKADTLLVNPMKMAELDQYMSAKQVFMQENEPGVGFKGAKARTPNGVIEILEFPAIPEGKAMLTRRDSWLLKSIDGFPHPVLDGGPQWHLEEGADAVQSRQRYYAQLGNKKPKHSTAIDW